MKVFAGLAVALILTSTSSLTVDAQESSNDQKIAEMQSTIADLKAELESLRPAQDFIPTPPAPVVPQPENAPANLPTPANVPAPKQVPQTPRNVPYPGYYPPVYPQSGPLEPIPVPQPPVVIVEPTFCPYGGFGGGYNSGFYVGPQGWGMTLGGLQLDFYSTGRHGHRGGHGHHGHHGH